VPPGREDRAAIGARLRAIASQWQDGAPAPAPDASGDLAAASATEILDFIDHQLGRAAT
jgi:hypothetical protein